MIMASFRPRGLWIIKDMISGADLHILVIPTLPETGLGKAMVVQ